MKQPVSTCSPGVLRHLESLRSFYANPRKAGPLSRHYTQLMAQRYNQLINPMDTVLEIGCGEGGLLSLLNGREKLGVYLS